MTDFSVGQVWKYKTRPHEGESTLTIVGLDQDAELGNIIHIYVSDTDIKNPHAPDGKTLFIGHLPYAEQALRDSVTEFVETADSLPDFEDGYKLWKTAFDDGEAGVFDFAVSEAIAHVEQNVG